MTQLTPDDLIRDMHIVAEDLEILVGATANDTHEKVVAARKRAQQLLDTVKDRFLEVEHSIAVKARAAAKDADGFVRQRAWEKIAAAAKAGIHLGLVVQVRKQKQ